MIVTGEHKVFTELGSADRDSPSCLVIPQTLPPLDWADVCGRVWVGDGKADSAQQHCSGTTGTAHWHESPGGPPLWEEPVGFLLEEVSSLTA